MRWGGALIALFLCVAVCLLVVALRVRTLELRARTYQVHRDSLFLEGERDRWVRELVELQRVEVLEAVHGAGGRNWRD